MWGVNHPTLLETQNFMTPCYFGAPNKSHRCETTEVGFIYGRKAKYSKQQKVQACEGFQGQFKAMLFILNLNIASKHKMREAIKKTLNDYIDHYPQKRPKARHADRSKKNCLS